MMDCGQLNVLFIPFFAPSHIFPMEDIARVFGAAGGGSVAGTMITTTNNVRLFRKSSDNISIHTFKLPAAEVGLPEGIENFGQCDTPEKMAKLGHAIALLQKPMEQFIRESRPHCIVSDMFFPWTVELAEELKVPRIMLYPNSSFFHCVSYSLRLHQPHHKVQSETETFLVPGLKDKIEMARSELQDHMKSKSRYGDLINSIRETEKRSYGIILTSFYELEPDYFHQFKEEIVKIKCWNLGPLSHFTNRGRNDETDSANGAERNSCLSWLDTQNPKSVVYICFGSMVLFSDAQLIEMALALEAAGHPFVWVVRKSGKAEGKQEESWMPEGFEERMVKGNKGMIIKEWAPQIQILEHPAIGGFLNHCGWNSLLESITAGVPMISWPLFAEHFYNAKLLTQVLKMGIEIGPKIWNSGFEIKSPLVGKQELEKALRFMMGGSEEAKDMRTRAKEMEVMAKKAVEQGGSSHSDLINLIQDLKATVFG